MEVTEQIQNYNQIILSGLFFFDIIYYIHIGELNVPMQGQKNCRCQYSIYLDLVTHLLEPFKWVGFHFYHIYGGACQPKWELCIQSTAELGMHPCKKQIKPKSWLPYPDDLYSCVGFSSLIFSWLYQVSALNAYEHWEKVLHKWNIRIYYCHWENSEFDLVSTVTVSWD